MTVQVLLWLLAAMAAGAALIALGLRGKRLNDHPICRDCRFDLSGTPEGTVTCPECGAGLKRVNAVRIGQRRRRPVLMASGAALAGFPLALIGAAAFALLTGSDVDTYKPLGLLLWEARHSHGPRITLIARELSRRVTNKSVSPAQRDRVVQAALEVQEDVTRPWCQEWGDLIEDARVDGKLSTADQERYRRQATVMEWSIRPKVRAGDAVPIVATVKEARVGSAAMMIAFSSVASSAVDGTKVKAARRRGPVTESWVEGPSADHSFQLAGSKNPWGMGGWESRVPVLLQLPADTAAGSHRCEIALRVKTILQPSGGSYTWPSLLGKTAGDVKDHTATLSFESLPAEAEPIEVVPPTEEMTARLRETLRPQSPIMVWVYSGFASTSYSNVVFSIDGLPVPVAFDVSLKSGDRTIKMGSFTSGRSADQDQLMFGPGMDKQRSVQGNLAGVAKASTVTVVLKPSVQAAARTLDLTRIYGGELVFENVAVRRQQQQLPAAETDEESTPSTTSKKKGSGALDWIFGK